MLAAVITAASHHEPDFSWGAKPGGDGSTAPLWRTPASDTLPILDVERHKNSLIQQDTHALRAQAHAFSAGDQNLDS
jgi:hypothetical protein